MILQSGQAPPGIPGVNIGIVPPQTNFLSPAETDLLGVVGAASWGPVNVPTPVPGAGGFSPIFGPSGIRKYDLGATVAAATYQGAQNMICVRQTDGSDVAATGLVGLRGTGALAVAGSGYAVNDVVTLSNGANIKVATLGGATVSISSGTYNNSTGLVTLALASAANLSPGASVTVASATGTGAFATINGAQTAGAGTGGSTLTFTIATGLTMTITGGSINPGVIATFSATSLPTSMVSGTGAVTQVSSTGGGSGATFTYTYTIGATATSLYTGSGANGDIVTVSAGNAAGSWKVVVSRPGGLTEVFNNIGPGTTGQAAWNAICSAVNSGLGFNRGPSQLVVLTVGTSNTVGSMPSATLSGGTDGATGLTPVMLLGVDATGARTGLYALRKSGCSVAVIADADNPNMWSAMAAYGLSEGTYMVAAGPAGDNIANAVAAKATAGIDSYAMKIFFGDWVQFFDQVTGVRRTVSPAAFAAGWIAANGPQFSSLNKPLFGIIATQRSASGTVYQVDELQQLEAAGIDVIANPSPGGNYFASQFGHNSASSSSVWGDNYTRMTNFIAATLQAGLGGYVGKLQLPTTQAEAKAELDAFFDDLWRKGAIGSSDPTVQPWLVVLDGSNNPQSQVARGIMQADVKVIFASVIEVFQINVEGGQTVQITRVSTTSAP